MEKTKAKKTSVTFSGITSEMLEELNRQVAESGLNRADFLAKILEGGKVGDVESQKEIFDKVSEKDNQILQLEGKIEAMKARLVIYKKHFLIPDKVGVILRALVAMGEATDFSDAFDYIFEPYWKQNKLVADEADKREYLEWKRKILEDDGDNQ